MRPVAISVCFALALSATASEPAVTLKVPPEVRAPPATISEVRAETSGKVVKWVALTPGLSVRPIDDGRVLLFSGPAGRYELLVRPGPRLGEAALQLAECLAALEKQ